MLFNPIYKHELEKSEILTEMYIVLQNVGLLCNAIRKTFLCILGIKYVMLMLYNLTGFEEIRHR